MERPPLADPSHRLPAGDLSAVDCAGPSSCMAVGSSLAAQWNGRTWRARTPSRPIGCPGLLDVSCPSAARCMAVGWYVPGHKEFAAGITERWNCRTWQRVKPAGRSATRLDVACARPAAASRRPGRNPDPRRAVEQEPLAAAQHQDSLTRAGQPGAHPRPPRPSRRGRRRTPRAAWVVRGPSDLAANERSRPSSAPAMAQRTGD